MDWLFKLRTETMSEFIERSRPTETSKSSGAWIACFNERDKPMEQTPRVDSNEQGSAKPVQTFRLGESKRVLVDLTGESETDDSESENGVDSNSRSDDDSDSESGDDSKGHNAAVRRGRAILKKLVEDLRVPIKGVTKKSLREEAVEALKQVAIECEYTVGKWVVFPPLSEVDDAWAIIAKATVEGRLGDSAKVLPCKEDELTEPSTLKPVICAYTSDFRKIDKVKQMLECLIELDVKPTTFKLDLFTYLDIDFASKSVYGIPAGIYTPKSILEPVVKTTKTAAPPGSRKRKPDIDLTSSLNDFD